jgi:hypothetical protein
MAMWLYQLSEKEWSRKNYRLDIWEGERWEWEVGRVAGVDSSPEPGDTVAFFYAPSGSPEPAFTAGRSSCFGRRPKKSGGSTSAP